MTTIMIAFESPLKDPNSEEQKTIELIDNIITFLFLVETLLKIVSFGFIANGPNSYLRSSWNRLDFFIVVVSLLDYIFKKMGDVQFLKLLRSVRLLRPIRIVMVSNSLKSAIYSLIKSVPKVIELLSLVALVIFMMAILETYLFSGTFNYCYIDHLSFTQVES